VARALPGVEQRTPCNGRKEEPSPGPDSLTATLFKPPTPARPRGTLASRRSPFSTWPTGSPAPCSTPGVAPEIRPCTSPGVAARSRALTSSKKQSSGRGGSQPTRACRRPSWSWTPWARSPDHKRVTSDRW